MTDHRQPVTPRRVLTGTNESGKSTIVLDENTDTWVRRPDGSVVADIWRVESLPTSVDTSDTLSGEVLAPPPHGLVVRMCTFAPNSDMDAQAYATALAKVYGTQPTEDGAVIAGMHRTDTVDVVTVISGEIYAVLESGETLLRPGDSFVQRGTMHAWHNRSGEPTTVVSVMMSAARAVA